MYDRREGKKNNRRFETYKITSKMGKKGQRNETEWSMKNMAEIKKLKKVQKLKETEIWKANHKKREIKQYERKMKWKEKNAKMKE